MNKKLIAVASATVVTVAAGGSAAAISNAQTPYNPYNPYTTTTTPGPTTTVVVPPPTTTTTTPTTPTLPPVVKTPRVAATDAAKKIGSVFTKAKLANRKSVAVSFTKAAPGKYTVKVTRKGTSRRLFSGTRTLGGSTAKTLRVSLKSTASSRKYLRNIKKRGTKKVKAVATVTFKAPGKKSVTIKRNINLGL